MKDKLKREKGITLIALIITIIIMLILAMVSISIIKNQGIITKSKEAADRYNEKAGEEQANLTEWERLMVQYGVSSEEAYVEPVTEIEYKGQTLKVGDYVNYDEGTGYSYKTDRTKGVGGTVVLASRTYKTEEMNWRVLGVDASGNLELISDKQTTVYLYIKGKLGYENAEEVLNDMCNTLYGKGTNASSARSLKANDIDLILGYNKRGFSYEDLSIGGTCNFRYGWQATYYETRTVWHPKDSFVFPDKSTEYIREGENKNFTDIEEHIATDKNPITIISNIYWYERGDFTEKVDSKLLDMIFGENNNNNDFWLTSQYVDAYYDVADWGLLKISYNNMGRY